MRNFFSSLFLTSRFYAGIIVIIVCFVLAIISPVLETICVLLTISFFVWVCVEIWILFRRSEGIKAHRNVPQKLSNGDENSIFIHIKNNYPLNIKLSIIDELPFIFQRRDVNWKKDIAAKSDLSLTYSLKPTKRGSYAFGALHIYASTFLSLVERRFKFDEGVSVPVYPSFLQMKKYEIAAFTMHLTDIGIKKIRKLGNTTEFEKIKDYVIGDDPRFINWKATARSSKMMVNQYQDEKAQPVYALVDKGRLMKMPFNNLTLLDYSINATLVILNIALKKGDKAGLITFSNKLSSVLKSDNKAGQLSRIQEALYHQKTHYKDSNFGLLSTFIYKRVAQRSLLLLFTNFETKEALDRQINYFRSLAKKHVLVVIFFDNVHLKNLINSDPNAIKDIYHQTIAEKLRYEKQLVVKELAKYGIYSILTTPEQLTINTINKYLTLKAQGIF